jgi:hypothetical protein
MKTKFAQATNQFRRFALGVVLMLCVGISGSALARSFTEYGLKFNVTFEPRTEPIMLWVDFSQEWASAPEAGRENCVQAAQDRVKRLAIVNQPQGSGQPVSFLIKDDMRDHITCRFDHGHTPQVTLRLRECQGYVRNSSGVLELRSYPSKGEKNVTLQGEMAILCVQASRP